MERSASVFRGPIMPNAWAVRKTRSCVRLIQVTKDRARSKVGGSVVEDCQLELAQARGIADHVGTTQSCRRRSGNMRDRRNSGRTRFTWGITAPIRVAKRNPG